MELIDKYLALQNSLLNSRYRRGIVEQDLDSKLKFILKTCAQQLNAERASVWLFNKKKNAILSLLVFNGKTNSFETGYTILEKEHPNYFAALKQSRVLNITNAREDIRTNEFLENYLKPLNIFSMLDIPLFKNSVLDGVLCIEHTYSLREWDMAEISYAVSVADVISLSRNHYEWAQENQKLRYLERVDALTNLENRCFFEKRIEQDIASAIGEKRCSLVLVGLDSFTRINDEYGYDFANKVLCKVARRLSKYTEALGYNLARLHGDTFAIWFLSSTKEFDFTTLSEQLQSHVTKKIKSPNDEEINITASIGGFIGELDSGHNTNIIRKAEIAMAKAKASGMEQHCLYDPEWQSEYAEELQLEKEFLYALENQQIVSHFQPIVGMHYQLEGISLESLVRWEHPQRGIITPYILLPLAQRLGMMEELGNQVLEDTCKRVKQLIDQGVLLKKISINITSEQLASQCFIAKVQEVANRYQVPFDILEFEIVEEAIASDSITLAEQLKGITSLGIQLSIDDFGTGYSSLSRLKHLNVSKLKIDKSFVDGLPDDEGDVCIAKSIIGLAKGLNLQLVAEGVETEEQAKWLLENGCEYLQGYLFSKPIESSLIPQFSRQLDLISKIQTANFTIVPESNIVKIVAKGVWYIDTFERFIRELDDVKDQVKDKPWSILVYASELNFGSIDFQKTIGDFVNQLKQHNLRATAYIVDNQDLVTQQLELINSTSDVYKRAFFLNEEDAIAWLKELGF